MHMVAGLMRWTRLVGMMCVGWRRRFYGDQRHAALRTLTGCILDHFGVHRTSILLMDALVLHNRFCLMCFKGYSNLQFLPAYNDVTTGITLGYHRILESFLDGGHLLGCYIDPHDIVLLIVIIGQVLVPIFVDDKSPPVLFRYGEECIFSRENRRATDRNGFVDLE